MGVCKTGLVIAVIAFLTYRYLRNDRPENLQGLLTGKNVIVTGASSGIGEQFAIYYAKQGANVIVMARREKLLQEVVKNCYKSSPLPHGKAIFNYVVADFNDVASSEKVMKTALHYLGGKIDYLVLNHAYLLSTRELVGRWTGSELQHKTMNESLNINFLSFIGLAEVALPYLKKTQGSICAISSFMTEIPGFTLPYAASKSAMNAFFTGIRQELIHENIDVSVTLVHLGLVQVSHTKSSLDAMANAQGSDMEELTNILPKTYPDTAAADLAWATVNRQGDVYYPYDQGLWFVRVVRLFLSNADVQMKAFERFLIKVLKFKTSLGF